MGAINILLLRRDRLLHTIGFYKNFYKNLYWFICPSGTFEVSLDCKNPMDGSVKLTCISNDSQLDHTKYVLFRVSENAMIATVHLPAPGDYCLQIFGEEKSANVKSFSCLWKYLIISKTRSSVAELLELHEKHTYDGHTNELTALGLTPKFGGDPFIKTKHNEILLYFSYTNPVDLSFNLTHFSDKTNHLRLQGYVISQTLENEKSVHLIKY